MTNTADNQTLYPWLRQAFEQLSPRIASQQLHHGLLFIADEGIGEGQLIKQTAKALLCAKHIACGECKACLLFDASSHPDLIEVVSDKPSIGIDAIRLASQFVTTTSQLLGNKVVLIEDIERMTESASNALLKTLEEPSNNTFVLLSTKHADRLLATIKSRCEKIRLSLPNTDESLKWIASQGIENASEHGLEAYSGSPLHYLNALKDSGDMAHNNFISDLKNLIEGKVSSTEMAGKWQSDATSALKWVYQELTHIKQDNLLQQGEVKSQVLNKATQKIEDNTLDRLSVECQQAHKPVQQAGINKSLILQRIFSELHKSVEV